MCGMLWKAVTSDEGEYALEFGHDAMVPNTAAADGFLAEITLTSVI